MHAHEGQRLVLQRAVASYLAGAAGLAGLIVDGFLNRNPINRQLLDLASCARIEAT